MIVQLLILEGYISSDDLAQGSVIEKVNRETIAAAKHAVVQYLNRQRSERAAEQPRTAAKKTPGEVQTRAEQINTGRKPIENPGSITESGFSFYIRYIARTALESGIVSANSGDRRPGFHGLKSLSVIR